MTGPLAGRIINAPKRSRPRVVRAMLAALMRDADAQDLGPILDAYRGVQDLLAGLADHSPYLWRLITSNPKRLLELLRGDPDARISAVIADTQSAWSRADTPEALMKALRLAKQEIALLVALCDLGGLWPLEQVTGALADFADAALQAALRFELAQAAVACRYRTPHEDDPARDCGLVILALGKHGARELNYSSDIDIVVFFDPAKAPLAPGVEPTPFFVRIVKGLVRLMQERTAQGYVFRTDLRLRPDPASTSVAISLPAAFDYYETVGQNWERAALIKARPVAGDLPLGDGFIAGLAPFIWRKYFDFAAIADIHAMKRQIHAVRGHDRIAVAGHDIKLGRGGIREIEFFVQTQQLVFGGRRPSLRGRRTLDMLAQLRAEHWITPDAERDLTASYHFFRSLEHRLQMIADEQTQRLPVEEDSLTRFARFCGFSSLKRFADTLTGHALKVEKHYGRLFEVGVELTSAGGSLVFTGTGDDPETLDTLRRLGFTNPSLAAETVRGWHFGRRQAVASPRAREVLTELVPPLLESFSGSDDPGGALAAFDQAMSRMPAAIELFSILKSHRALRDLFAGILGSAPRLAQIVALRPHVLDAVIDPSFAQPFPDVAEIGRRLAAPIGSARGFEELLDRLRDGGRQEIFLVGARMLSATLSPAMAGQAYASVAQAVIRLALADLEVRFQAEFGSVPGGRMAVIGMGRLGSREMTASSDLDLIVLYDFNADSAESDGPTRLAATTYYTRLTQRLISALTVPTSRGTLYDVDMRLRPSGSKGPAATQFRGFLAYQRDEAELWEHLALTRARPVAGDPDFMREVQSAIHQVLCEPRDRAMVLREALAMRRLIAAEKGEDDPWELKLAAGGLLDIEFIAQSLVLCHAHTHSGLAVTGTAAILTAARDTGLLTPERAAVLIGAHAQLRDVFQWIRLTVSGRFDPGAAGAPLKRRLAAAVGLPDFAVLQSHLNETRANVRAVFEQVMGA